MPGTPTTDDETTPKNAVADCPGTKIVIGGGFVVSNVSAPNAVVILASRATDANTWTATSNVIDLTGGDQSYSLAAFAICAQP